MIDRLPISRRHMLKSSACGFGMVALNAMMQERALGSNTPSSNTSAASPLAAKPTNIIPHAKRVIFLFMQGGPSQMDLFDYKPRLARETGNPLPFKLPDTEATVGLSNTRLLGPIAGFRRAGQCGMNISELLPRTAERADDLCVLRAVQSDSPNHPTATRMLHTGTLNSFLPAMGSWLSYGLGTENQQLPSYITILPAEGERNYSSAFLPAIHQGTPIQDVSSAPGHAPIRNLTDSDIAPGVQRKRIDLLQAMNRRQLERLHHDQQLEGSIEAFELAFRMQTQTPKLVDLSNESKATLDLYGVDKQPTDQFARQCLLARRFAEAGVRFVQVSLGGWDHHGSIASALPQSCAVSDQPIAALLTDLKSRGLLDETLVVWAGEFGRTPHSQDLSGGGASVGREHNPHGFTVWMAGGGVKGGMVHGTTDEYGYRAVDGKVHMHDLHATILYLLGLDHTRLTYRHLGRDFRLTDVSGKVVNEIIV